MIASDYHNLAFKFLELHNWRPVGIDNLYQHDAFPECEEIKDGEEAIDFCMKFYSTAWEHFINIDEGL